jgi:hypothetical protein
VAEFLGLAGRKFKVRASSICRGPPPGLQPLAHTPSLSLPPRFCVCLANKSTCPFPPTVFHLIHRLRRTEVARQGLKYPSVVYSNPWSGTLSKGSGRPSDVRAQLGQPEAALSGVGEALRHRGNPIRRCVRQTRARICKRLRSPGIDSASLCGQSPYL